MRLYDALWALAAADLRTSLENREFGHVLAATSRTASKDTHASTARSQSATSKNEDQRMAVVRRWRTT
jgi:hypothetical protein